MIDERELIKKISEFWTRRKKFAYIAFFLIWVFAITNAILNNPTKNEAKNRELMMKNTVTVLMQNGGKILHSNSNVKYGSSYLFLTIDAENGGNELTARYDKSLIELNWRKVPGESYHYCKDGVLATLEVGIGVRKLEMSFNQVTLKKCKI